MTPAGGSHHLSTQGGAIITHYYFNQYIPIVSPFFLANFPLFMPISPLFIYTYIYIYNIYIYILLYPHVSPVKSPFLLVKHPILNGLKRSSHDPLVMTNIAMV